MKGTVTASGRPNSAMLTLGSGKSRAGEVREAPRHLQILYLPKGYVKESRRGKA